ncbi:MAG TPA: zinc ribbon domain-containing protein [Pyrinomonadaceae bacterium]|nr:zinc ribbon domain-containing protein [Pyrinomonadaceae bacterium]
MSEYTAAMDMSGSSYTVGEHSTRRIMTGDAEAVRRRLITALEMLGYSVVNENPLHARRAKSKNVLSADFTEHARKISVSLRPASETATIATFDFAVVHGGCMMKGDLLTLEREADAIIALATSPPASGVCRACGTENASDARFCRLCGAPNASGAPGELEVLRLTAGSRASLQEITVGLTIALAVLAITLPMILFGKPKAVNTGWIFLALGQVFGWWMTLYGILRLHRTLNSKPNELAAPSTIVAQALPHAQTSALPPARFSVTEGTTELLGVSAKEKEKVHVRREQSDTSQLN